MHMILEKESLLFPAGLSSGLGGGMTQTVPSLFPNFLKVFKQLLESVGV